MKDVVLFGAGQDTLFAVQQMRAVGRNVAYYVDNNIERQGTKFLNILIIGFDEYLKIKDRYDLIIAVKDIVFIEQIEKQLRENGIDQWEIFDFNNLLEITGDYLSDKVSFVSYAQSTTLEDLILYHVLHDLEDIFYIDVGSESPDYCSVTKTLYDKKIAHGINIEPQEEFYKMYESSRERDINLCVGVGNEEKIVKLYRQGGCSTTVFENVRNEYLDGITEIKVVTLDSICEKYVNEENISFLKIDVEGAERSVLEGINLKKWRPWIILLEAVEPITYKPNYMNWEDILLSNEYHFVYEYGVNRYYVSNEMKSLDEKFIPMEKLLEKYYIKNINFDKM